MSEEERDALAEKIQSVWESSGGRYHQAWFAQQAREAAEVALAELSQLRSENEKLRRCARNVVSGALSLDGLRNYLETGSIFPPSTEKAEG